MNFHDCVVIVPCFNEEKSIALTISQIREDIPGCRIIVIDNDSSDNTASISIQAGVKVLFEPQRGKGYAIRRAFKELNSIDYSVVLMIDGDATYSTKEFQSAYDMITKKSVDMIIGNRISQSELEPGRTAPYRRFHGLGNLLLSKLNRALFKLEISDVLSGWRAFSPSFVRSFSGGATGFEIESELNIHAYVISVAVGNLEVQYKGRLDESHSKLSTFRDGFKIIRMQFRLFRSERPNVAYSLLSLPWFFVSSFLMIRVISKFFSSGLVPNFPSLIAGVAAFIVGALLWTTGMILTNVRMARVQMSQMRYRIG
jgi:glycosyltransferase involved in cell wall biosynthesis